MNTVSNNPKLYQYFERRVLIIGLCIIFYNIGFAQRSWCSYDVELIGTTNILRECRDTMINDTLMTTLSNYVYKQPLDSVIYERDIGYLYEDDNKMFIRYSSGLRLVYDFNLNVGDRYEIRYPGLGRTLKYDVAHVDSIEFLGQTRRRIFLTSILAVGSDEIWVSGVGSVRCGFETPGIYDQIGNYASRLLCFSDDLGTEVYQADTVNYLCYIDQLTTDCNDLSSISSHFANDVFDASVNIEDGRLIIYGTNPLYSIRTINLEGMSNYFSDINSNEYIEYTNMQTGMVIVEIVDIYNNRLVKKVVVVN